MVEADGRWTSSNTYEWDFEQDNSIKGKLKSFLNKLPKDKIKSYYYRFVDNLKSLPEKIRRKLIVGYTAIFLGFVSASFLLPSGADAENLPSQVRQEVLSALGTEKKEIKKEQHLRTGCRFSYSHKTQIRGRFRSRSPQDILMQRRI